LMASLKAMLVGAGNDFHFEFQRLINHLGLGIQYRCFFSENFSTWTETTPVLVSTAQNEDNPEYEIVRMQLPVVVTTGKDQVFVRMLADPTH